MKNKIEYDEKKLPDVFRELKEKQDSDLNNQVISVLDKSILYKSSSSKNTCRKLKSVVKKKNITQDSLKNNFKNRKIINFSLLKNINLKKIKLNSKNNFFIIILIICFVITMFLTNSIFATQVEISQANKESNLVFENNENTIDLMSVLHNNMSITKRKEIITEQSDVNYMIIYKENSNLPKNEQVIVQEGKNRKTRNYENSYI